MGALVALAKNVFVDGRAPLPVPSFCASITEAEDMKKAPESTILSDAV